MINAGAKQLFPRRRPDRLQTNKGDNVRMPTSSSFPSGHAASAFAFATAASAELPQASLPLYGLATIVGYSRVHVGVHYPSDVLTGAVLGSAIATLVPMIINLRPPLQVIRTSRYSASHGPVTLVGRNGPRPRVSRRPGSARRLGRRPAPYR